MLFLCIVILFGCSILHFYNHFTFEKIKNSLLYKITTKHEHHGSYPVIFNIYCILQVLYSIYVIIYFAYIAIPDDLQLLNTMYFILLYPLSLIHTNNYTSISSFDIKDNMIYSNSKSIINISTNFNSYNYLMLINITFFIFIFLFEGFFNFYRFYGVYNVQTSLKSATLSKTIKIYSIYASIFILLSIINILFSNIFSIFIMVTVHFLFNIFCEYRQIFILINHSIMDGISDKIDQNPSFLEDEFAEILTPLIICRRFCVIATILSSIYLIGIYAGFTSFYFLIFYPIFFSIITTLQTMSFVRNRLFIQTEIFYYCCHKSLKQTKHDDDDNHIFYENEQDSNITPNPPNTIFQMQQTEDSIERKDSNTSNIKIKLNQIDNNMTNNKEYYNDETNHNYNVNQTDIHNNGSETDNESKTTIHHGLDMSPIAENIEADINSVVDIEALMVQQISGGGLVGIGDNANDSESEEVSSLLFAKSSIRSPNSVSSRRDDMKTINEEHEVIDFSGVIGSPVSMARFLSSPTGNVKCPPPGNNSRQHSTRDSGRMDEISIGTIDQILGQNSRSLDTGNDREKSVTNYNRDSGNETDNDGNSHKKSRVKHGRMKNKNGKHSKSKGKAVKEYKLETDDLLLTLRMLVNDGLVEEKSASHVKSLRIRQQRLRNTIKQQKGTKVEEEVSFLLSENSKNKNTDLAINKSKEKSVPFEE